MEVLVQWFTDNLSQFISAEIDCRGQLVDEAIANIDKYIDDAYLSGLKQVVIIHGKGTGALRAGVQNYLKMNFILCILKVKSL